MNTRLEKVLANETGESLSKWLESKRAATIQTLSKDWYFKFVRSNKSGNTYQTVHIGANDQSATFSGDNAYLGNMDFGSYREQSFSLPELVGEYPLTGEEEIGYLSLTAADAANPDNILPSPQYTFPEGSCSVSIDQNLLEAA